MRPVRAFAVALFRLTDWREKPVWRASLGQVLVLPFGLAGFLVVAAFSKRYAVLGAVAGGAVWFALTWYGENISPSKPKTVAERLDALAARADETPETRDGAAEG